MKMNFDCIWMGHNCLLCITFKTIGGKQLIYDSVCAGQDYKLQMFSGKEFHLGVTSKKRVYLKTLSKQVGGWSRPFQKKI